MAPTKSKFAFPIAALLLAIPATHGNAIAQSNGKVTSYINTLPKQTLSAAETADLVMMRQEEKLARDVYKVLYDVWKLPAFSNIAASEQSHMDLCKFLLDRYALPDPNPSDAVGIFKDAQFTHLFQVLVLFGIQSQDHALVVGAFIEDLDIADLDDTLARSDNRDLDTLYQNLQLGSRNHLRSFYGLLANRNLFYPGIVLPTSRIVSIALSPHENGAVDENGLPL
ncbi:MAG: DUF2202 domain-containing protein [Planctomycetes bacterium]|nr:DUF2202 domain-containing protein [Planctomycetota bacterium]